MSGLASDAQIFSGAFQVHSISDPKYDRVDRIFCTSIPRDGDNSSADGENAVEMSLDINKELFPCKIGDNLEIVLATTLAMDGSKDDDKGWRDVSKMGNSETTLADMYDYVCHGKIYKFEDGKDGQKIKAYVSFGGLLMALEGPYKRLTPLRVDYVYLLAKK
ncbi:hypothetical protein B0H63DRAFT_124970 [Podospora didyma]|uniref:DNA-directed RNA polymerases I, II, and III subunit RPABC3 n=1 Tax=Podospora didyma TaxID=330526 RepID=A0AAE0P081_9PEZI|nr:hypothetical protein B0H63DRAFT_124970 [Podospora didyma]